MVMEMETTFTGLCVTVSLTDGTVLEGTVVAADGNHDTLTLKDVSRDGRLLKVHELKLSASEIADISRGSLTEMSAALKNESSQPIKEPRAMPSEPVGVRISPSALFGFTVPSSPHDLQPMDNENNSSRAAEVLSSSSHAGSFQLAGSTGHQIKTNGCVVNEAAKNSTPDPPLISPHQVPSYWLSSVNRDSEQLPNKSENAAGSLAANSSSLLNGQSSPSKPFRAAHGNAGYRHGTGRRHGGRGGRNQQGWIDRPLDSSINKDFDFEGNLSKFDKAQIFAEIEGQIKDHNPQLLLVNQNKPASYSATEQPQPASQPSNQDRILYRDQQQPGRHFTVRTEAGVSIPLVTPLEMEGVYATAEHLGLSKNHVIENAAHSVAGMALSILGGERRMNVESNQSPLVVVLAGSGIKGASAIGLARHLACHNVFVVLCALGPADQWASVSETVALQLRLFSQTSGCLVHDRRGLERAANRPIELIVDGLVEGGAGQQAYEAAADIIAWARDSPANTLSLDFPSGIDCATGAVQGGRPINPRWTAMYGLPKTGMQSVMGSTYLVDVGLTPLVFARAGIRYTAPFGNKYVILILIEDAETS